MKKKLKLRLSLRKKNKIDFVKFRKTCIDLAIAAKELNLARDEFRQTVYKLAGTDLYDWSIEELQRYVELGYDLYVVLPKLKEATKLAQSFVDAIEKEMKKK